MNERLCRLCSTSSIDPCLNIFSAIGIKKKMVDILSEHFKYTVTEADPLPNVVCHECWTTTESFHALYEKSKDVKEKFLNLMVKNECDLTDMVWSANSKENNNSIEEINVDVDVIKVERNSGDSDSDNEPLMDYVTGSNDENNDSNEDEDGVDEHDTQNKSEKKALTRKRWQSKKNNNEYQKLFSENRHLFDMSCDFCSATFDSLDEGRAHYLTAHNNTRGYIKCCGKKMFYRCNIVSHLVRHSNPDKFKCLECNRIYSTTNELERHIKRHQEIGVRKEKNIPCDICRKMFSTQDCLQRHKHRHTNDSTENKLYDQFIADNFDMSCDLCDATFIAFHDARRHYKECHNEEKGWIKCCGTKLRLLSLVRDHIKKHLNPELFKCEVCSKRLATRRLMLQHRRQHRLTMNKQFICHYCGKSCRDKGAITRHLFTNHVNSEPKFECQICQKKFQLQSLLKNHTYAVHREKKRCITCEICGKSFYTKFHLDKHMLSHTDKSERLAMRKQCEHCGEWLMTKSGIYYHEQLHTSGIQKCNQCDMELPNRPALMGHIRQYHRAHKHKCGYCTKTYSTAFELRTHEESHTRHKTYQCKFCPKVFTVRSSRQTHTRRNHQQELKIKNDTKHFS